MNAHAHQIASSLPLIQPGEIADGASRLRWRSRILVASLTQVASVLLLLAVSVALFSAGFLLSFITLLLAFARFTGADVAPELLLQFACAIVAATWASGACWEKMREMAARQKRPDGSLSISFPR